jgi:predicted GIY-YIG superfamily endonuclease
MTVYLLHLHRPLDRGTSARGTALQAGHYIGFTTDLVGRTLEHLEGRGARFTQVCVERGIPWTLARTWEGEGATRTFERRLKNCKKPARFCPICNPGRAMFNMTLEKLQ